MHRLGMYDLYLFHRSPGGASGEFTNDTQVALVRAFHLRTRQGRTRQLPQDARAVSIRSTLLSGADP